MKSVLSFWFRGINYCIMVAKYFNMIWRCSTSYNHNYRSLL